MNKHLSIRSLNHSFGPTLVLDDITVTVEKQKIVALVGPSGCGKTTLLKLCAGLIDVIEGDIHNPFKNPAYMFQQANLLPWKNTLDNIALGLKAAGMDVLKRHNIAREFGFQLDLSMEDMHKFPHELSGGMQQRVALARAMIVKPDLLLLDEPFSALDIGLKLELYQLLLQHTKELSTTVLMITHDLMEAVRLSDAIYLMKADPGSITAEFNLDRPASERNDSWVYQKTADLMSNPSVINSFGLSNSTQRISSYHQ